MRVYNFMCLCLLLTFILGCKEVEKAKNERIKVVCTTSIVADCMKDVLPNEFEVYSLMGAGVDPHIYKPSPKDLEMLDNADVVIASGLHLEGKFSEVFEEINKTKLMLFVASYIDSSKLISHGSKSFDPHIWFDVKMWQAGINGVALAVEKRFEKSHFKIQEKLNVFNTMADSAHLQIKKLVSAIPKDKRVLITSHDAFSYFSKTYGFEVKSVQGMNTMIEAGLFNTKSLIDFILIREIPTVFVEYSVNDKSMKAIIEVIKSKGKKIYVSEPLCSDALGKKGTKDETYFGMLLNNSVKIKNGLIK